jgi:hypothetical protein
MASMVAKMFNDDFYFLGDVVGMKFNESGDGFGCLTTR